MPKPATIALAAGTLALLAALVSVVTQPPRAAAVAYDMSDKETARSWVHHLDRKAKYSITAAGLKTIAPQQAFIRSPRVKTVDGLIPYWNNFPYIRLQLTPQEKEYSMYLVWMIDEAGNDRYLRTFTVPSMADMVLIDVRQSEPEKVEVGYPWAGSQFGEIPISYVGFVFTGTVEIKRIELLPAIGALEFAWLSVAQYWQPESIEVYSVNIYHGTEIAGVSLTVMVAIVALILFGLLIWIPGGLEEKLKSRLLGAVVACFVLSSLPLVHMLWEEAVAGTAVSAWHADRYDEYRSRFGAEFADLDEAFQARVPAGSRVAFPISEKRLVNGEINWIWFLYYGLYANYTNRDYYSERGKRSGVTKKTDYVFYYHPQRLVHDETNDTLQEVNYPEAPPYKTQTIVRISKRAKILKIIRG